MSEWVGYKNYDHFQTYGDFGIEQFFLEIKKNELPLVTKGKTGISYYNIPCSFDIETSSMVVNGEKFACMYLWAFGINGSVIVGRTWEEFDFFIKVLTSQLDLSLNKRLLCYVHNLGYEFQFFRKRITWVEDGVFSVKKRRPVKALAANGIEYRCSLLLSNYRLAYVGAKLLMKYPVQKMVGDLDYSLIRHSKTPITDKEMMYQVNDVRVVMSYIQEKIENEGGVLEIPLTNTGYVRRYCRNYCLGQIKGSSSQLAKKKMFEYRVLMKDLQITSAKEYQHLKQAFAGGFTHANPNWWGKTIKNVGSADLTSSYPYTMVSDYFPMSGGSYIGEVTDEDQFERLLSKFCCLFTVKFYGLYNVVDYDNYISLSKCTQISSDRVVNNGRVATASELTITITELDWDIISKVYDWDEVEIFDMRIYMRGYLPRPLIMSILDLYKNKTSLKGVDDQIIEYMVSKNMINAAYGMTVTNIVRDEIIYGNQDWEVDEADPSSQLVGYNKQFNRFLFYAWGVWVTAHARHNLWEAILEFENDYVYADTDSVKGINFEKHQMFFDDYNIRVRFKLQRMCRHYKIPFDLCEPLTKKGEKKLIGVWDMEEPYLLFKTIGAKRYIYEHTDHSFNMTVAGVNKASCVPYLLYAFSSDEYRTEEWLKLFKEAYDRDPKNEEASKLAMKKVIAERVKGKLSYENVMKFFKENLVIPPEHTGKQLLTYIDDPMECEVTDYLGNKLICSELSSIHMEPAMYNFSITSEYLKFLAGIEDGSI